MNDEIMRFDLIVDLAFAGSFDVPESRDPIMTESQCRTKR